MIQHSLRPTQILSNQSFSGVYHDDASADIYALIPILVPPSLFGSFSRIRSCPPQVREQCPNLWSRHAIHAQSTNLGSSSKSLQAHSDLPAFVVANYEDVFLAVRVADTGTQDMFTVTLARLRSIVSLSWPTLTQGRLLRNLKGPGGKNWGMRLG